MLIYLTSYFWRESLRYVNDCSLGLLGLTAVSAYANDRRQLAADYGAARRDLLGMPHAGDYKGISSPCLVQVDTINHFNSS